MDDYEEYPETIDRETVAKVYQNLTKIVTVLEQACIAMPDQALVWDCINEMEGLARHADMEDQIINSFTRAAATAVDDMRSCRGDIQDVTGVEDFLKGVANDGEEEAG